MKKCGPKERKHIERVVNKVERKRLKRKRRKEQVIIRAKNSSEVIEAPFEFLLLGSKPRAKLLRFLKLLRDKVAVEKRPVTIDFRRTERMWADGALLFKAELCRLLKMVDKKGKIRCIAPENHKINQVLKQVGVYSLLSHTKRVTTSHPDVVSWRYANGSDVDGRKYDEVLGHYEGVIPERLAESLYVGLTEAMTNCAQHAYIDLRKDGLNYQSEQTDWWMFSQEKDGALSVAFCDLGVGIPSTVPKTRPKLMKRIFEKFTKPSDAQIINEAVEDSRSRTGKHYRGKGLPQLSRVIEEFANSDLMILSNRGKYHYRDGEIKLDDFSDSIMGTLILWRVPINEKKAYV